MKKIITKAAALALVLAMVFTRPAGAQTLYEDKTVTEVYKGLSYERSQRITPDGLRDVHVLTVDLNQPHLQVKPIASKTEHGLKETLTALMDANGAAAGVNGDFFGMAGAYSAPLGVEIIDGKITGASEGFNSERLASATFFISEIGTPFMGYVKTELKFLNNGAESLSLYAYNRITDAVLPFYIDRSAYASTKELDARFPGLYKIVVESGFITYISSAGQIVDVPERGFIVLMNEHTAGFHLSKYAVGQSAEVKLSAAMDITKMQAAISGGGKILTNGSYTEEGYFITGRHPRTALGLNADRSKLILMVVDGRGSSIGASHGELAELLWEYGAHDAMHFDGGGSSTLAVKGSLQGTAVKNTPSDGAQRKIINGLGVFNSSTLSEISSVEIETAELAFKGMPTRLRVYGLDSYRNKMELTNFTLDIGNGHYSEGYLYPAETGLCTIAATYSGITAVKQIKVGALAQINTAQTVRLAVGGEYSFNLTGKSGDSYTAPLNASGVTGEVVPAELASYSGGKLIGQQAGAGYVKLFASGVERYVRLIVGTRDEMLDNFEPRAGAISYLSHPEGNAGQISYNSGITQTGSSLELTYTMQQLASTQAAYAVFDPPLQIPGKPSGLKLSVYGDNSNNWLRGRVTDANGTAHTIDFARYIDWTGFKTVEAKIPPEAVYPLSLDRIYVASLENTDNSPRRIYLEWLSAVYPIETDGGELPASTIYTDNKQIALGMEQSSAFTDITLLGDITSEAQIAGYADIQNLNKAEFNTKYNGESFGIFLGKSDNISANMPVFKWSDKYNSYKLGDVNVLNLVATKGSMYASNQEQWQRIKGDLFAAGNNVLVIMDRNPQTALPKKELELLHGLLVSSGKNIIVASAEGRDSLSTVADGIRYVNLGALFVNGEVNPGFKTLRVRFFDTDIKYSLK